MYVHFNFATGSTTRNLNSTYNGLTEGSITVSELPMEYITIQPTSMILANVSKKFPILLSESVVD